MADYTVNNPGTLDGTGAAETLFIQKYQRKTLQRYKKQETFMKYTTKKVISGGKGFTYTYIGKLTAGAHTPGALVDAQQMLRAKKEINIDGLNYSAVFMDIIDLAMLDTDEATRYADEMGYALVQVAETNTCVEILKAANANSPIVDQAGGSSADFPGGTKISSDKFKISTADPKYSQTAEEFAKAMYAGIIEAATTLDNNNVSAEGRYIAMSPKDFNNLFAYTDLLNKFYGASGNIATGKMPQLFGFNLIKTNYMVHTNVTGDHAYDATKSVAVCFNRETAATVIMKKMIVDLNYFPENYGWLYQSAQALGHGWLRPETAVEFSLSTGTYA